MAEQKLVDAKALSDALYEADAITMKGVVIINQFPTVEAKPVVHGQWIDAYPDIEPNPMFMYGICSECGFEQSISKYLKYCPDCGAKMDKKENDNG